MSGRAEWRPEAPFCTFGALTADIASGWNDITNEIGLVVIGGVGAARAGGCAMVPTEQFGLPNKRDVGGGVIIPPNVHMRLPSPRTIPARSAATTP